MAKVRSREKLRGDDQASAQILAEQREPLIKVAYASKDGQVKELVHRRPPPNRFAMSEQDVDDVAFLTGEISRWLGIPIPVARPQPSLRHDTRLLYLDNFFFIRTARPDGPLTTFRELRIEYEARVCDQ